MQNKIPRVILLIEDSSSYCRDLIRGISRYSHLKGPWTIYRDIHNSSYSHGRSYRKEFYDHLSKINADGLITRSPKRSKHITDRGIPTITARTEVNLDENMPRLDINHIEVGKIGAEYFMQKGYKSFAFYGNLNYYWASQRHKGFAERLNEAGFSASWYRHPSLKTISEKGFEYKLNNLADWLKTLPKPTAIMACSDAWATNVIESAKIANIHIPEQLALLGVDNDEPICESCFPRLSSIQLNGELGGYKMAELLDKLMKGEKQCGQKILVSPVRVITRTSTDIMVVEDEDVAHSLQFIRTNQRNLIQVVDVAEAVGVSLRTLQNKFRESLDRTILEEIKNTRISYAKELLLNSDMNVSEISDYMNFPGINSFSRYFKTETSLSPMEYRKQYGRF
ncbi:MAG: DNA-binding transcriptional regulator [Sedimentisphaeraceae bacterium JB056]